MSVSSFSLSLEPLSSSRTAISPLVRSSPGRSRLVATSSPRTAYISLKVAVTSSGEAEVWKMLSTTRRIRSRRFSSSSPNSSEITWIGSGYAYASRRSTTSSGAAARSSRSVAQISSMRGRRAAVRRAVNALETRVRSRRWSLP